MIGGFFLIELHNEHHGYQLLDEEYPELHRFCTIFTVWQIIAGWLLLLLRLTYGVKEMAKYILFLATMPITIYTFVGFELIESTKLQELLNKNSEYQGIYDIIQWLRGYIIFYWCVMGLVFFGLFIIGFCVLVRKE